MEIHQHRREYPGEPLREEDMDADPVHQFRRWFQEALDSQLVDPTAMVLATTGKEGQPSVRVVLLKGFAELAIACLNLLIEPPQHLAHPIQIRCKGS